jgi:pimeloyl-ACP methyl ester carboxylesterase
MIVLEPPVVVAPAQADALDLVGRWEGALSLGATSLPIVIRVSEGATGVVAVMDSPAQGARDIPVSGLGETGGVVRFAVPSASGRFEGRRSEDGSTWTGAWSQGGASLPLILRRAAAAAEVAAPTPSRPQTPVPPFPYGAEDVTFDNGAITLAGTLTLPRGAGPFPAVVLITGSGAQDRDETLFDHKPFAVWADALTRRGVAVLRYDDRGVGGSGGGSKDETTADFAGDAAAAVAFLARRPDIDPARIGLMGHSEGGAAAQIAAADGAPIAFLVMIAGPAMPGADIVVEQVHRLALAGGQSPEQAQASRATQARIMAAVVANKDDGEAARRAVETELTASGLSGEAARQGVAALSSGWYRYFAAYDPAPALRGLRIPLLAVYGGNDPTVPADLNRAALAELKPDADIVVLPGLNHLMQTAESGLPNEYATLTETLAPSALATVTDWIVRIAGAR